MPDLGQVSNDVAVREFNSAASLYYYRARYYDVQTGRFPSEDLLRFGAGYNFYAYVANKPTEFSDPMGLLPTGEHYNRTLDLARAAFGPKCLARARAVAQANADQDALPGFAAKLKFVVGLGDGWKKGSIHFGGPVDQSLQDAFSRWRVAQTINSETILGAAYAGFACPGLESTSCWAICIFRSGSCGWMR